MVPTTPEAEKMQAVAASLFDRIERGEAIATTSEVVLHEVCYVLASKEHYNLSPEDISAYLLPILRMPGLKLGRGEQRLYHAALNIYVRNPKLGFADAVIAARCIADKHQLATFDNLLGSLPDIRRWQP